MFRPVLSWALLGATAGFAAGPADAPVNINWPEFLGRQDAVWKGNPGNWGESAFIGNGDLGATIHTQGRNTLAWEINRTAVTSGGMRYPMGRVVLQTSGEITGGDARIDIWNGEARGTLHTDRGDVTWHSLASAAPPVIQIDFAGTDEENQVDLLWFPVLALPPDKTHDKVPYTTEDINPAPDISTTAASVTSTQRFLKDGAFAVALRRASRPGMRKVYFLSVGSGNTETLALAEATDAVERASSQGADTVMNNHRNRWHSYCRESFVSIPDPRLEAFYWIQVYKMGSAMRSDGPVLDLMGPWFRETPWPGPGWSLTTQLAYAPLFTANRLDLGKQAFAARKAVLSDSSPGSVAVMASLRSRNNQMPNIGGLQPLGAVYTAVSKGQGDAAFIGINGMLDRTIRPNTFFAAAGPVIGTSLALADAVEEMLLQSSGGVITVFPAVPKSWKDASFANLRAEGGFLVSAVRKGGTTAWVKVASAQGGTCKLSVEGAAGDQVEIRSNDAQGGTVSKSSSDNWIAVSVPKGGWTLLVFQGGDAPLPPLSPVDAPGAPQNPYVMSSKGAVAAAK